jgi:hypothetical protein
MTGREPARRNIMKFDHEAYTGDLMREQTWNDEDNHHLAKCHILNAGHIADAIDKLTEQFKMLNENVDRMMPS